MKVCKVFQFRCLYHFTVYFYTAFSPSVDMSS